MLKFDFSNDAIRAIGKLDSTTAGRIFKGIMGLPHKGDIKPMEGYSDGRKRLRIGGYRVVFSLIDDDKVLRIIDIGSRGDIYKEV
jgi:mRNA interferase RelE/StbE